MSLSDDIKTGFDELVLAVQENPQLTGGAIPNSAGPEITSVLLLLILRELRALRSEGLQICLQTCAKP